jgi:CRISPR/Cas system CMR-associated protein Cmr5 small subunit
VLHDIKDLKFKDSRFKIQNSSRCSKLNYMIFDTGLFTMTIDYDDDRFHRNAEISALG